MKDSAGPFLLSGYYIRKYGMQVLAVLILLAAAVTFHFQVHFDWGMCFLWIALYMFLLAVGSIVHWATFSNSVEEFITSRLMKDSGLNPELYKIQFCKSWKDESLYEVSLYSRERYCHLTVIDEQGQSKCHAHRYNSEKIWKDQVISDNGYFLTEEQIEYIVPQLIKAAKENDIDLQVMEARRKEELDNKAKLKADLRAKYLPQPVMANE